MKKIMFNDKFGLTDDVLEGNKTMTRRNTDLYEVGEVVAIAQKYKDAPNLIRKAVHYQGEECKAGWNNKMFVKAEYMPHHIRILSKRQERLQDISNEDCLREGITHVETGINHYGVRDTIIGTTYYFYTPRKAFAFLIDRVGKRGTWESNPLVWVYEFELID